MSFAIEAESRGVERASKVLIKLSFLDTIKLADGVGEMVEGQTTHRIHKEKMTPEGDKWAPWSPGYAKTRHGGQSLLESEGHLRKSIQHVATSTGEEIGSNLAYAATQQLGSGVSSSRSGGQVGGNPGRAYLGLSRENDDDIEDLVNQFIETEIGI